MARGTVDKRCQCRDRQGRRVTSCRKDHGSWWFKLESPPGPTSGRRRQVARGGYRTKADAESAMTTTQRQLDPGVWLDDGSMTVAAWLAVSRSRFPPSPTGTAARAGCRNGPPLVWGCGRARTSKRAACSAAGLAGENR